MSTPDDTMTQADARPFLSHLEDLRRTVVACGVAFVVALAAAVPLAPHVVRWLRLPVARAGLDPDVFLRVLRVAGGLSIAMRTVAWTALLLSLPLMAVAIGWFVFPGLKGPEKRILLGATGAAGALFAVGVVTGYAMLPMALRALLQVNDWIGVTCEFVDFADYVVLAVQTLITFGLMFELPILVLTLGAVGLLTADQLRNTRRHVLVALLVMAMILTPSTDPVTMLVLALPLALLHEGCIWVLWLMERRRGRQRGS